LINWFREKVDVTRPNIFGLVTLFATATSGSILDLSHMVENQITLDHMKLYQKHVLKVVEMHKKQKIGDLVLLHKNLNHACFLIFPIDRCENEFCVHQTECEWVFSVGFTTFPEHFIVN
jgi:hypothetical protein